MDRKQELIKLKDYIDNVEKETTLLLQNLQWDLKHLLQSPEMVSCKYVAKHKIPRHAMESHEKQCYLTQHGYSKDEVLLPDPVDPNANTIVKLSKQDIMTIINSAASLDPSFKRGAGSGAVEPLSAARLQLAYSADERRAIHAAVVAAAPACHDLADLALGSSSSGPQASKEKSRAEILSELRDMKRRRTRYRVAANTAKYSDVLRDVIKTQMELYAEAKGIFIKTDYGPKTYVSLNKFTESEENSTEQVIKQERTSPETDSYRHTERSRESTDRRRKSQYQDREAVSKRSRDRYDNENSTDKRKYKEHRENQEKYPNERRRREESHSRREKYHRTNDTITNDGMTHDGNNPEESSTSKHFERHYDSDRNPNKYGDRNYSNPSTNASKYESSSKEHQDRSYREDSSKNSKYNHRRKYEERERHKDSNRHQEEKHRRYYDDQVMGEKVGDYEGSNDERKKRQRH